MFGGGDKATISALRSDLADKDAQIETLKVCSYFFFLLFLLIRQRSK